MEQSTGTGPTSVQYSNLSSSSEEKPGRQSHGIISLHRRGDNKCFAKRDFVLGIAEKLCEWFVTGPKSPVLNYYYDIICDLFNSPKRIGSDKCVLVVRQPGTRRQSPIAIGFKSNRRVLCIHLFIANLF